MLATERYHVRTVRVSIVAEPGDRIDSPPQAVAVARGIYRGLEPDCEHFVVLALNARGRANGYKVVSTGTLTASLVHPREVFRAAIQLGAASIIVVHNHPSGDPSPSSEDELLTERLKACGDMLGIPVVDSIVIGGKSWASVGGARC